MDIQKLLVPSTPENTPLTDGTMDVQNGLILSTVHRQHIPTISQPSVTSDQDTSMTMRSVGALSNQCNTQFITIKDRRGQDVSILTNVRIGSTAASEKRRRNAVASAKCRLNMSQKIVDLRKKLFETHERLEKATAERDHLKSIVEQNNMILAVPYKGL